MLKCNLAVLLAERKLKISKVAADTGISRTTLTALSSNQSQGIQFDTLNTICSYLRVTPSEFFCYAPFNFKVVLEKTDDDKFDLDIRFNSSNNRYVIYDDVYLFVQVYLEHGDSDSTFTRPVEVSIDLPDDEENFKKLQRYMKGLSPIFKRDIEQAICESVYNSYFSDGYEDGDCTLSLTNELKRLL